MQIMYQKLETLTVLELFFFPFYTGNEVSLEVKFSRISYLHRKNVYLKTEPPILDI